MWLRLSLDAADGSTGATVVFKTGDWRGEVRPADPDEAILDARLVSPEEAVEQLRRLLWAMMREPIMAHLDHEIEALM